jgi:hypothetical protein
MKDGGFIHGKYTSRDYNEWLNENISMSASDLNGIANESIPLIHKKP